MKVGDFTNRVFIEQLFKTRLKTRQIVSRKFAQQAAVITGGVHRHINVLRFQWVQGTKTVHRLEDAVAQAGQPFVFGFNGFLQPVAHFALAVVA